MKMKISPTGISCFLCILLFCFSCKKAPSYSKILEEAEQMVWANPDSAMALLSKIVDPNGLTDREKADYGFLVSWSHVKTGKASSENNLILYSLEYYKDNQVTDKLALTYMSAAYYYLWNNNQQMALAMLQEGLDFCMEIQNSVLISEYHRIIGEIHLSRKEYREAIRSYQQVEKYTNNASMLYFTGLCFGYLGIVDSIDFYMNKAINLATEKNDINSAMHYRRNYADILYYKHRYSDVLSLQKQVMRSDDVQTKYPASLAVAQLYLEMRQPDSACIYIDSARLFFNRSKIEDPELMKYVNDDLIFVYKAIADYAQGNRIDIHQLSRNIDEQITKARQNELLMEEKIDLRNRLEQHNLMLTINRQRMLLYISWGTLVFMLTVAAMSIYIRRKRKMLLDAQEKREVLEKLLKETVTATEKDSSFFKKILLQQLGLIKIVASTPTNHNKDLLKQVSLIHNEQTADDMLAWDDLYQLIDTIYHNYFTKMTFKYGDLLTEKEKQLCCLLCAGFSTKEISVISQQGLQTIYQRKTTIRQKLKMDEKEDIVEFIAA